MVSVMRGLLMRGNGAGFVWLFGIAVVVSCTNDFDRFNFGEDPTGGGPTTATTVTTGGAGGMTTASSSSSGQPPECSVDADCPGADVTCNQRRCAGGMCFESKPNIGTACTENGGQVCDGQGNCVECVDDLQCPGSTCNTMTQTCVGATCMDTTLNGDETDIDCGGSCPPCADNLDCNLATDCNSLFCDTVNGPCGGGGGGAGGMGGSGGSGGSGGMGPAGCCQACVTDTDCAGAPNTWCDSGSCAPLKANGTACAGDNECTNGNCPGQDSVCCDTACNATCEACLMTKTTVADGTCALVTVNTDLDNDCTPGGTGCAGNDCSGTSTACLPDSNTSQVCRVSAGDCDVDETCDGANVACPTDAFVTQCQTDGACTGSDACDGAGSCLLATGQSCTMASQCCGTTCSTTCMP
jgi:hypothetical protein